MHLLLSPTCLKLEHNCLQVNISSTSSNQHLDPQIECSYMFG
jgi:hypothetical protein